MADFVIPELGENVAAGDVVRIMVKPGDQLKKDQPVLELETDKATIEVPSSVAGVVKEIKIKQGQKVKVGEVVLTVDESAAAPASAAAAPAASASAAGAATADKPGTVRIQRTFRTRPHLLQQRPRSSTSTARLRGRRPLPRRKPLRHRARPRKWLPRPRRDATRASSASTSRRSTDRALAGASRWTT